MISKDPLKGLNEHKKEITEYILKKQQIPQKQWEEAKNWIYIRQEVSKHLKNKATGRSVPEKNKKSITPNREAFRMLMPKESPFRNTYPKHIKTEQEKYKYLCELKNNNEIGQDIFEDLTSVLKIKK